MAQVQFAEDVLFQLQKQDPRYHPRAYVLVLGALNHVMESLTERRHITGAELAEGVRTVALDRFGLMARTVLDHWGVRSTEDMGEIVFALVEGGMLVRQEGDSREDFCDVYDFAEAFEENYPWGRELG